MTRTPVLSSKTIRTVLCRLEGWRSVGADSQEPRARKRLPELLEKHQVLAGSDSAASPTAMRDPGHPGGTDFGL